MRIIHEFRKNNDILSAAREAGELLDRWRRRAKDCKTFYVVLSKPTVRDYPDLTPYLIQRCSRARTTAECTI